MPPLSADSTPEKRALSWRLEHDIVAVGALRVAAQRIGIGHWQPGTRLRSWGLVPLHRNGDAICVPCNAGEAMWLGAWLEDSVDAARVRLRDPLTGANALIALPPDGQLTTLEQDSRPPQPVALTELKTVDVLQRRELELRLECGSAAADLKLVLLTPGDWASQSARTPPPPCTAPPPLPPRLG